MQNWRISDPDFFRNMARPCHYGALDFFVEQTSSPRSILSEDIRRRAFASIGNDVQIPVLNYDENVTVSNTRSCVIQDNENTSALYNVVWADYAVGFSMVPALYHNNEISYEADFNFKMAKITNALADALDKAAVTALEAGKTQVFKDLLNYTETANVIEVPTQMRTEILADIPVIMGANCYPSEFLHIVGNAGVESLARKLAEHGLYNDVDKRMELYDKILHFTNNVTNGAGKNGTFFAVADGNVGVLTRVDREALRRARVNGHEWDVVELPRIGLPVGTHYYSEVGDASQIAGAASADMTCVEKQYFGFSLSVAFLTAYNSNPETVASPIIKAEITAQPVNQPTGMPVMVTNAADFRE